MMGYNHFVCHFYCNFSVFSRLILSGRANGAEIPTFHRSSTDFSFHRLDFAIAPP